MTLANYKFSNFAQGELLTSISNASTSLVLAPTDAVTFPDLTGAEVFRAAIFDGSQIPEIIECSAIDKISGVLTISRAAESTVARAWNAGSRIRGALTSGVMQELAAAVSASSLVVENKVANYTITTADNKKCFTNRLAPGDIVLTLPPIALGLEYEIYVDTTHYLKIQTNGTDNIRHGSDVTAPGGFIRSASLGSYVHLKCLKVTGWAVTEQVGEWLDV